MSDLHGIVVGEFGKPLVITCVNTSSVAVNISTYTISVKFHVWKGTEIITLPGTYVTDGTDGKLTCAFTSTSTPVLSGKWRVQVILTKTGFNVKSKPIEVEVWEAI
jgi:hypothetical protein